MTRIEVFQFEEDLDYPKKNWKQRKHITTIITDHWAKIIPEKGRILVIYGKKQAEKRYNIDRIRYIYNEETSEFYLHLIVSKVKVSVP